MCSSCHHEAAHSIVALAVGADLLEVRIRPRAAALIESPANWLRAAIGLAGAIDSDKQPSDSDERYIASAGLGPEGLANAERLARRVLTRNRNAVESLAERLHVVGYMDGDQVRAEFGGMIHYGT